MISINERSGASFGCLMLFFDIENWDYFIKNYIKEEDVYDDENHDFGLEFEAHCTVIYGFNNYDGIIDDIKKHLSNKLPEDVYTKKISIFPKDDHKNYDVVKFDIISEQLKKLNNIFKDNFKITSDYPDYHPHMTIAYVQPGKGKEYTKKKNIKIKLKSKQFVYSDGLGNKIVI
jgi:hypothetical protein